MGKTPIPLVIWVAQEWAQHPMVEALRAKGHRILVPGMKGFEPDEPPDLILHPAAHWWDEMMFTRPQYLEIALKAARERKRDERDVG